MRQRWLRVIGCIALLCLSAVMHGDDATADNGTGELFVPWKVLNPGDEPMTTTLVLYWVPGSRDEIRRSDLLVSHALAMYATQCVGMQVIRPDDGEMIEKLEATGKLPMCVLAGGDGKAIAHVGGDRNPLRLSEVEKMVRDELDAREAAADRMLDAAQQKLHDGEREVAVDLYRQVAAEQCLFPRKAKDAQKALKKLGVEVTATK